MTTLLELIKETIMSYEGYVQLICENGHLTSEDTYYHDMTEPECSICKGKILWENQVDETNGDDVGKITYEDMNKYFRIQGQKLETCPTCNHVHEVLSNLYRVPLKEETQNLRTTLISEESSLTRVYIKDLE
jgi:hypothetical protein